MTSDEYLDIWEKFSTTFRDVCHFSFNFLTELTHDAASNLGAMDDRLRCALFLLKHFGLQKALEFGGNPESGVVSTPRGPFSVSVR